jgi:hypothetical protein
MKRHRRDFFWLYGADRFRLRVNEDARAIDGVIGIKVVRLAFGGHCRRRVLTEVNNGVAYGASDASLKDQDHGTSKNDTPLSFIDSTWGS